MKLTRIKIVAVLALVAAGGWVAVPPARGAGTLDFSAFKLVTDRNIFDPNRYPHSDRTPRPRRTVSRSAPAFGLVGTMEYHKGMFAFFDGNSSDYRLVLQQNGVIAGYTVTGITLTGVTLKSAGTNSTSLDLKIGEQMRLDGDAWEPAGAAGDFSDQTATAGGSSESAAGTDTTAAPSGSANAGGPVSDVLKRLMQQRAQETK